MKNKSLIEQAKKAAEKAYSPYSGLKVGAALLTSSNEVFTGCNIENSSFGLTNCAERTAIFKAISEGHRNFKELVIYTDQDKIFFPCGACRQVIAEFCEDLPITIVSGRKKTERTLKKLFPDIFKL